MLHLLIYHLFLALFQRPLVIFFGEGVDSPTSPRIVNKTGLPRINFKNIVFRRNIHKTAVGSR